MNHEIQDRKPLHNERGLISEPGYSRELLLDYDRSRIQSSRLRIKEWDFYLVGNETYALAFVVADNGYMGLGSVTFFDFEQSRKHSCDKFTLFPLGNLGLPSQSREGRTCFRSKKLEIEIVAEPEKKLVRIKAPNFLEGEPLEADIVLGSLPRDSIVIATPYKKGKAFYYNQKVNCMQATGRFCIGSREFDLNGDLGVLDWGRGVWSYNSTWYWSSLSTWLPDGSTFGFNLGYGFGDTSAASENMLFYNGVAHKLDQVDFGLPERDGQDDFLSTWSFSSNDDRLNLKFHPVFDSHTRINLMLIGQNAHQVFGHFSGEAILDDGKRIQLENAFGFAEKVHNRW